MGQPLSAQENGALSYGRESPLDIPSAVKLKKIEVILGTYHILRISKQGRAQLRPVLLTLDVEILN